jgi:hypothetical protein
MTEDELKLLHNQIVGKRFHPKVRDVSSNHADRTLLYGYNCDRDTFHVYAKDGDIHLYVYNPQTVICAVNLSELGFTDLRQIIPDKRAYPQHTDFDFASWVLANGGYISFTTYGEPHNTDVYVAPIFGE